MLFVHVWKGCFYFSSVLSLCYLVIFFKLSSSSNMLGLSVLSGGIHSDLSTNNFLSWMSSSLLESLIDSRNAKKFGSLTRRENSSNAFWISALSDLRGLGINFRPLERTLISSFVRMCELRFIIDAGEIASFSSSLNLMSSVRVLS